MTKRGSRFCRFSGDVYVAGGGNAAGQAAMHFSRVARSVTMVVRKPGIPPRAGYQLITS
jgi:thioredoxin reductase (NADPH)